MQSVVQVIWGWDKSWFKGYAARQLKGMASKKTRCGGKRLFQHVSRLLGMNDRDLPNPTAQTLLFTFYRNPSTYGMIRERESIARVQRSKPLALAGRCRLERANAIVPCLEKATWPPDLRLMVVEIKSVAPTCLVHPTCRVQCERVSLSWLHYAQVWQIFDSSLRATDRINLPEQRTVLNFAVSHHCVLSLSKGIIFTNETTLWTMSV